MFRWIAWSVIVLFVFLAHPLPAYANIGLPMLIYAWPAMLVLFIPVVLIEAVVATTLLGVNFLYAVQIAGVANLVSTILGIPTTWLVLVCVQVGLIRGGAGPYGLETLRGRILSVTVQCPWLIPYPASELDWMIPTAEMVLCIPFFVASVFCEYFCAVWFTHGTVQDKLLLSWSWLGNALSYGLIVLVLSVILIRVLLKIETRRKENQANEPHKPDLKIVRDVDRETE